MQGDDSVGSFDLTYVGQRLFKLVNTLRLYWDGDKYGDELVMGSGLICRRACPGDVSKYRYMVKLISLVHNHLTYRIDKCWKLDTRIE